MQESARPLPRAARSPLVVFIGHLVAVAQILCLALAIILFGLGHLFGFAPATQ